MDIQQIENVLHNSEFWIVMDDFLEEIRIRYSPSEQSMKVEHVKIQLCFHFRPTNVLCVISEYIQRNNQIELSTIYYMNRYRFVVQSGYNIDIIPPLIEVLLKCNQIGGFSIKNVDAIVKTHFRHINELDEEKINNIFNKNIPYKDKFILVFQGFGASYINGPTRYKKEEAFRTYTHKYIKEIKHRAAIVIGKYFRGWLARKKYAWNPYTSLGRYYCMKEFKQDGIIV
jgi:hypothetical protein